ncbi:MAG: undecaprenyl-phosphate glucose phosphotransferase [Hyphomicrobium sp.]|uniref:undecaprenyl-phosphate glucose phosphotransferase n=1 Tax=Hyphomicrobium sp. TaxID=82 RepID=UPI0039E64F73
MSAEPQHRRAAFSSHVIPQIAALLDSAVILLCGALLYWWFIDGATDNPENYSAAIGFVWITSLLLMNFAKLYQLEPIMRPLAFLDDIIVAFVTTMLFLLAAAYSLKISESFSRAWMLAFAMATPAAIVATRLLLAFVLGHFADRGVFTRFVVVLGSGRQAIQLLDYLAVRRPRFISVLATFSDDTAAPFKLGNHLVRGNVSELDAFARANRVDDVIIAVPWDRDQEILKSIEKLRELPVNIYLASDLIGFKLPFRPSPDHYGDTPLVEVLGHPLVGWGGLKKAMFDYCLAIIGLVIASPLFAIIAIAIACDGGGPIFYRQPRYGFSNQIFSIWKFRTMAVDSDTPSRTVQAKPGDPRVTRIGRLLRKTSLDELPQLLNVLNGTMSLVGPRPHAVDHNEEYARLIRGYFARHRVKPGITGWAQVNGFRGATERVEEMEARVRHDIFYIENWSLFFDFKILLLTMAVSFSGKNAY